MQYSILNTYQASSHTVPVTPSYVISTLPKYDPFPARDTCRPEYTKQRK